MNSIQNFIQRLNLLRPRLFIAGIRRLPRQCRFHSAPRWTTLQNIQLYRKRIGLFISVFLIYIAISRYLFRIHDSSYWRYHVWSPPYLNENSVKPQLSVISCDQIVSTLSTMNSGYHSWMYMKLFGKEYASPFSIIDANQSIQINREYWPSIMTCSPYKHDLLSMIDQYVQDKKLKADTRSQASAYHTSDRDTPDFGYFVSRKSHDTLLSKIQQASSKVSKFMDGGTKCMQDEDSLNSFMKPELKTTWIEPSIEVKSIIQDWRFPSTSKYPSSFKYDTLKRAPNIPNYFEYHTHSHIRRYHNRRSVKFRLMVFCEVKSYETTKKRLFYMIHSLSKANYMGVVADLHIILYPAKDENINLSTYDRDSITTHINWKLGDTSVKVYQQTTSPLQARIEAWNPSNKKYEIGVFLDISMELSPRFPFWLLTTHRRIRERTNVFGISLEPMRPEIVSHKDVLHRKHPSNDLLYMQMLSKARKNSFLEEKEYLLRLRHQFNSEEQLNEVFLSHSSSVLAFSPIQSQWFQFVQWFQNQLYAPHGPILPVLYDSTKKLHSSSTLNATKLIFFYDIDISVATTYGLNLLHDSSLQQRLDIISFTLYSRTAWWIWLTKYCQTFQLGTLYLPFQIQRHTELIDFSSNNKTNSRTRYINRPKQSKNIYRNRLFQQSKQKRKTGYAWLATRVNLKNTVMDENKLSRYELWPLLGSSVESMYFPQLFVLYDIFGTALLEPYPFQLSQDFIQDAQQNGHRVVVTTVNTENLAFWKSWMCNLRWINQNSHDPDDVNHLKHECLSPMLYIWLATDWTSYYVIHETLQKMYSDCDAPFNWLVQKHIVIWQGANLSDTLQNENHIALKIQLAQVVLIRRILHAGIDVLIFRLDSTWRYDPRILVYNAFENGADIVTTLDNTGQITADYLYARATPHSQQFFADISNSLHSSISDDDIKSSLDGSWQSILGTSSEYRNAIQLFIGMLHQNVISDGHWYDIRPLQQSAPFPSIIINNHVNSSFCKIQRAIEFNHWFWNPRNDSCYFIDPHFLSD